jgi:hypothetical protein
MAIPKEKPCPTAIRLYSDWDVPLGALLMAAAGGFALIGFPLDDMWHRLFGQDVHALGPDPPDADRRRVDLADRPGDPARRGHALAPGGRERGVPLRRASLGRRLPDRALDLPGRVRLRRAAVRLPLPADADRARGRHRARLRAPVGGRGTALGAVVFFVSCAASCR